MIRKDQTINTFVLPGGKIGVYTGIFPVAQTEAGMAIILGHEMGHAIARHAAERLSQQLRTQLVSTVLAAGLQGNAYGVLTMAAFGLGAQLGVLLPYSRLQEEAADRIGLVLSAQAGYDPQAAVGVWERMAKVPGSPPPEFLSTHPEPKGRLENIKQYLPQAMAVFRPHPDPGARPLPAPKRLPGRPAKRSARRSAVARRAASVVASARHGNSLPIARATTWDGRALHHPPRPNTLCRMVPDPRP